MGLEQSVRGRWLKEYPFEKQTQDWNPNPDEALFVDIGGNAGHYYALFKSEFPGIRGRIVLEDLPDTLTHTLPTPGVEKLGHDFFQPQPIKETGIPPYATALDLVMLGACGSLERTEEQWKDVLGEVGLEIKQAIVYDHELFHGIISATVA
ncbi:hypothetical protein UA08_06069 [Talaromyces atroroseus]|uniref:O-methyltransferase domain-containing protein n=1 Tax=Talaromyces atroroseus TaxID=1441469 RepID=A0A225ABF5_TALAT|nr:hypothetical protein UA08_06069 [Talaromyces atroroseus]OKL58381.1 hypothetical protein UA08_06069 [Talaromyces atroroseus]